MTVPLAIVLLAVLLLLGAILFKVWRIRGSLFRVEDRLRRLARQLPNTFRQLEALEGLYVDLRFERSLPATRGWAASPDFLTILARHALAARPGNIVECGSGVSTIVLARCCEVSGTGHVYSLEHLPEYAEQTRSELIRHGLAHRADVLDAPLAPHHLGAESWPWYSLSKLPEAPIDMLVVDGPPQTTGPLARYPVGPLLLPRLEAGGVVFLDDAKEDHVKGALARWSLEMPGVSSETVDCEKGCAIVRREVPR
jgi:predicted O-methyltransferase YrrM